MSRSGSLPESGELWVKCPGCREVRFHKQVERNLNVCSGCGYHFRLTVEQRIAVTADRGSWRELERDLTVGDPLEFVDTEPYPQRIERARAASGHNEAVVIGTCTIEQQRAAVGIMDFNFMGGSMGIGVGEKLARLFRHAQRARLPVIVFSASGGARMQEGILALMQMAVVASAIARFRESRLPYISVCTNPTTGGVAASFAMLGDLNLAEPGALIGFAGRRVIEQTTRQKLPENFQQAEFLLAHGMLDAIVSRHQMRASLARLISLLSASRRR